MTRLFKIGALCALAWAALPASAMPLGYRLSRQARAAVRQAAETPVPAPVQELWTVTFDRNGTTGTPPAARIVADGEAIGGLPTPERDGYDFTGWFTAASGGPWPVTVQ